MAYLKNIRHHFDLVLKDSYLNGHRIGGRVIFPATGYIVVAWQTLAESLGLKIETLPVHVCQVRFQSISPAALTTNGSGTSPTLLLPERNSNAPVSTVTRLNLNVEMNVDDILSREVKFKISEKDKTLVQGNIYPAINQEDEAEINVRFEEDDDISGETLYDELALRGFEYRGIFRGIRTSNKLRTRAKLNWRGNWVAFLDSALQFIVVAMMKNENRHNPQGGRKSNVPAVPVFLKQVTLCPELFFRTVSKDSGDCWVSFCNRTNTLSCPGIKIQGLRMRSLQI